MVAFWPSTVLAKDEKEEKEEEEEDVSRGSLEMSGIVTSVCTKLGSGCLRADDGLPRLRFGSVCENRVFVRPISGVRWLRISLRSCDRMSVFVTKGSKESTSSDVSKGSLDISMGRGRKTRGPCSLERGEASKGLLVFGLEMKEDLEVGALLRGFLEDADGAKRSGREDIPPGEARGDTGGRKAEGFLLR